MGLSAGVPDLIISNCSRQGRHLCGAALEVKRHRRMHPVLGKHQKKQLALHSAHNKFTAVCYGLEASKQAIDEYMEQCKPF